MPDPRHTVIAPSAEALAATVPIEDAQVRAHKLSDGAGATVVCIAFDAGTVLNRHIAAGPIIIETVTGEVVVEVDGEKVQMALGGLLHIDGQVQHEVRAVTKARILVTLMRPTEAGVPDSGTAEVPGIIRKKMIPVEDVSTPDAGAAASTSTAGGHDCTCGEADEPLPELDVRAIPHAIRHATVFGALDGLAPQKSLVLIAHHDPLPLLAQVEQRYDGAIDVAYGQRGPEVWKLQLTREG